MRLLGAGSAAVALGAEHVATEGTDASTEGSSFEATAALMTDDAADCRAADCADHGATTGIRAIFTGDEGEGGDEDENALFHDDVVGCEEPTGMLELMLSLNQSR
jgi:hypothetical protein